MRRALLTQLAETDLRLLRIFIAIAESHGLAAAELRLNISRSVISRHLKDLEARLGVRLCDRGRAGFALTAEGETVLHAARRLLGQLDAFRDEIAELHTGLRGELVIAIFDKFVTNPACRLSQAIAKLHDHAPTVRLELHVGPGREIERGLLEGRFHLGIAPFHRASDSIRSTPLFAEEMLLYCAPNHPLASCTEIEPDDELFAQANFVGLGYHSPNMVHFWHAGLKPTARAYDQEATAALILSGHFIGYLPEHYARTFESAGTLSRVTSKNSRYRCEWHVFYTRQPALKRVARYFLGLLQEEHQASR